MGACRGSSGSRRRGRKLTPNGRKRLHERARGAGQRFGGEGNGDSVLEIESAGSAAELVNSLERAIGGKPHAGRVRVGHAEVERARGSGGALGPKTCAGQFAEEFARGGFGRIDEAHIGGDGSGVV